MAFFKFFSKKSTLKHVLLRCTYCSSELLLSEQDASALESQRTHDPVCPLKYPCLDCLIGFCIPINYTDKNGITYLFSKIKPKIKNIDPQWVFDLAFLNDEDPLPPF